MKRILSVILSLALLASALIIPMSVSAEGEPLTLGEAAQNLIDAVDDLELDVDAARQNGLLTEAAYPVGSQTKGGVGEANVSTTNSGISISDTEKALVSKIGSKSVSVTGNVANTGGWGLNTNDLHALRYQYSSTVTDKSGLFCLKDIGYIVLYVKTNRAFKLGMSIHNNEATPAIIDGRDVPVTGSDYEPIIINMTKIDWTTQWDFKKAYMGESVNWGFFPAIESFTEGDQTIKPEDGIVFGSLFCIPVDTAVRDFKYDLTGTYPDYPTKKYETLSVDMILAAELIKNDDGRYTAESFAELQKAIKDAKVTLIADSQNGEANAVALFKAEAENLYKLEEVFRPKVVGSNTAREKATDEDVKNLSDYQKSLLGEHYIKINSGDVNQEIQFVDASATSRYPATPVKDYTKYRDIYLYVVNNTGSVYYVPTFNAYIGGDGSSGIPFYDSTTANGRQNSFKLNTTVTRCSIYALNIYKDGYRDWNVLDYVNNFKFDAGTENEKTYHQKYTGSSRIQWILLDSITEGSSLILGSMMGEKPIDVSGIDNVVTNKATLIKYYAEKIANNGYANTAAVEETMELLGVTTVEVVKVLDDSIGIKYPENPEYTLETAAIGQNVSFSLTNIPTGATVTVKYGDDVITDDNGDGYYEITVENGKVLTIIPSHVTTTFMNADTSNYTADIDTNLNLAKGITPYMFVTKDNQRTLKTGSTANFSDGNVDSGYEPNPGFKFSNDDKTFINGYKPYNSNDPTTVFNFNKNASEYNAFVDVIYDLGCVADINKIQHFGHQSADLTLGAYSVYASTNVNNLFNRNESLVVDYQNKTVANSQQHEFPTRSARFVAFRIYCPVTTSDRADVSNQLRIWELAIYGTPTGDYTVSEKLNLPSSDTHLTPEAGAVDLLNGKKATVDYTNDGGTTTSNYPYEEIISVLTDGHNTIGSHKDFGCATYQSNGTLNNGYTIERNADVNINFTRDTNKPIEHYTDFTFELNSYYKVTDFGFYNFDRDFASFDSVHKVQAFQVYIGKDKTNLYTENNLAITCENYFNNSVHEFKFNKTRVGKYIGVRVLMSNLSDNNIRIAEIAAYGDKVASAADATLKPKDGLSSESVFLWNKDNSSVYTGDDGVTEYTAARLSVKYQSPLGENGLADTSKICLANGESANIVERNVIAIAKTKYNPETGLDITTAGAKHSTATGEALNKCWKTNGQDVYAVYKLNNINSTQKDLGFVVVGRIVYEYNGTYYTEYSPVFGADQDISAQSVYNAAFGSESNQGWFKQ